MPSLQNGLGGRTGKNRKEGVKKFLLSGREGKLVASITASPGTRFSIQTTGDGRLGKGVLGAIPIHLIIEAGARHLGKGEKFVWEISLEVVE